MMKLPNLESLRDILGSSYPVTTCLRAGEALEKIAAGEDYSVIISDYMMPEMSGVEFFKELKQRQHSAPRIMVTGFAAPRQRYCGNQRRRCLPIRDETCSS